MSKTKNEVRITNGYRLVYEPDYISSMNEGNWKGYVYEHIFIVEKNLNRKLRGNEVVHHLDGNKMNNRIENLMVLERSQHVKFHKWLENGASGLETFLKKGMNSGKSKIIEPKYCELCGRTLQHKQKLFCSNICLLNSGHSRKIERPSMKQLEKDISEMSMVKVGKKYNVSDNAVRKWLKQYKLL